MSYSITLYMCHITWVMLPKRFQYPIHCLYKRFQILEKHKSRMIWINVFLLWWEEMGGHFQKNWPMLFSQGYPSHAPGTIVTKNSLRVEHPSRYQCDLSQTWKAHSECTTLHMIYSYKIVDVPYHDAGLSPSGAPRSYPHSRLAGHPKIKF